MGSMLFPKAVMWQGRISQMMSMEVVNLVKMAM